MVTSSRPAMLAAHQVNAHGRGLANVKPSPLAQFTGLPGGGGSAGLRIGLLAGGWVPERTHYSGISLLALELETQKVRCVCQVTSWEGNFFAMKQPPIGDCHRRCVFKARAPIIEPHVQAGACPIAAPSVHQHRLLLFYFCLFDHVLPQHRQDTFLDGSRLACDVPIWNAYHPSIFDTDVAETAARQYAGGFGHLFKVFFNHGLSLIVGGLFTVKITWCDANEHRVKVCPGPSMRRVASI